jgi:hypothetical protein
MIIFKYLSIKVESNLGSFFKAFWSFKKYLIEILGEKINYKPRQKKYFKCRVLTSINVTVFD